MLFNYNCKDWFPRVYKIRTKNEIYWGFMSYLFRKPSVTFIIQLKYLHEEYLN